MHAVILAAGRGSRMLGFTEEKPKCLTQLAGQSLLSWQLSALRQAGIKDIVVVRGYKKETLESKQYIALENPRWEKTNMVMTLACADAYLSKDVCIIAYADIVYHPEIITSLANAKGDIIISYDRQWRRLWQERFENPLKDAETLKIKRDGSIEEIGRRAQTLEEIQGQYMGLLKFTPQGWKRIKGVLNSLAGEVRDKLDMTSLLQLLIKNNIQIFTTPVEGRWCEADSEKDLLLYTSKIENQKQWEHDW